MGKFKKTKLDLWMKEKKITQSQLCKRLGCSTHILRVLLNRSRLPDTFKAMMRLEEVSFGEIMLRDIAAGEYCIDTGSKKKSQKADRNPD